MTFEELVYKRFSSLEYFSEALAKYAGQPAVFYQNAPDDKQKGWNGAQYPRIVYTIDMQADEERKSAGVMQVDLYCDEAVTMPEDIEPHIRECLKNLIVKPDGNSHYAFAWARTEMFVMEQKNVKQVNTRIIGATLRFDILEYSLQETTNPDPAKALSRWLKTMWPESLVIGEDKIETFYEPSDERPAFYVRVQSYKTNRTTYALAWKDSTLAVHIIAPDPESRNTWARYMADCLDVAGEVIMLDDSPMLLHEVSADTSADYLTKGQLSIKAEYAVARIRRVQNPLNKIIK